MSHERGFKRIIWRPLQVSLEFGDWYLTHTCKSKGKRTLHVSTVTTMAVVPGYDPIATLLIANLLLVR